MKKYIIIILFLITKLESTHAQMFFVYGRDYVSKIKIDKCKYSIIYIFKFANDTINKNIYYDKENLEIGEKFSRYSSVFADRIDSVWYVANKKVARENKDGSDGNGINPNKEAGLQQNEKALYEDVYTNYPNNGLLTVTTKFGDIEYIYEESIPKFEWKIQADTATIIGYKCMRATTTFRGRTYNVWFTPLIPIRKGPWKFSGLPGLILKAADTKGYFEWTAIGIETPQNRDIYTYDFEKAKMQKTSRENVLKLQHKRWQDPVGLTLANTSIRSIVMVINGKEKRYERGSVSDFKLPYIPIPELE